MPAKLKIGIAGLGRIGWCFHAKALQTSDDFVIAAVNDPLQERLDEAIQEFGCQGYLTYADMIQQADLDAVVIASPTHLHKDMALAAIQAGIHLLLEKPLAIDAAEAAIIVDAAEAADLVMTVYQPHRINHYFRHLSQLIANNRIGPVTRAQLGMFSFSRRDDWQSLQKYGGGMLNNYGAHGLDLLLQLIGYDIQSQFCMLQTVATLGDADDVVKIALRTATGALGELDISQASSIRPYFINVWGTFGGIIMPDQNSITIRWYDPDSLPAKPVNHALASTDRKYPSEEIDWQEETIPVDKSLALDVHANFAQTIRGESTIAVPPRETLALMELIQQLRTQAGEIADHRH